MTRPLRGLMLAGVVLAAAAAAFVALRASRRNALLAALPPIPMDRLNRSAQLLVSDALERLRNEPLRADLWGELGYVLGANGAFTDPGPCFARAEEIEPSNHRWPHLYAVSVIKKDRPAAIAALKRALRARPNVAPTLGMLGEAYLEDGAEAEADALLRPLVTDKTNDPRLLWLMARIEANAGANDRALELARRAAALPPHRRPVHQLLAQLYQRKGDAANARKEARLLELLSPADQEAPWPDSLAAQVHKYSRAVDMVAGQARALIAAGEHEEAVRVVEQLAPEDRRAPIAQATLAMAKAHLGDFKAAEAALDSAAPDDPNVAFARGILALLQNQFQAAAEHFLRASTLRPGGEGARSVDGIHVNRGVCLLALNKEGEAIASFEQALKINPGNFGALLQLTELYLKRNRKADAVRLLADAALLDPDHERVKELQARAAG